MMSNRLVILLLLLQLSLSGCASSGKVTDERDPWEGFNRSIYSFNENVDNYVMKPVARGYQFITPRWIDTGVSNFFGNLGDIPNALNNLLQAKPLDFVGDLTRFGVNSTIGLAGFFDVATPIGLEKHNEDFGQTLAVWGIGNGNYLVLPFLGPSSIRDGAGWVGDFNSEPYYHHNDESTYYTLLSLDFIDTRADLLGASRVLEQASFDPYTFHRETYFQHRQNLIYDGNPPVEEPSLEELDLLNGLELEVAPPK
ncbi:MAG: VacJ family lipoprotein [Gammaproteobacteria bacterium]|nr:VacJ family lipoprotein [Gammaproteobacteria bacterium]